MGLIQCEVAKIEKGAGSSECGIVDQTNDTSHYLFGELSVLVPAHLREVANSCGVDPERVVGWHSL